MSAPAAATSLLQDALVWDMTLPWEENFAPYRGELLSRYKASGVDFVSLTVAGDREALEPALRHLAAEIRGFEQQPDRFAIVRSVADIERARREHKLAVGFHLQGTNPLGRDLNMVDAY